MCIHISFGNIDVVEDTIKEVSLLCIDTNMFVELIVL